MEHDPEDILHSELHLHPLPYATSLCANERTRNGMEIGGLLSGWQCHRRAVRNDDLQDKGDLGLYRGMCPPFAGACGVCAKSDKSRSSGSSL